MRSVHSGAEGCRFDPTGNIFPLVPHTVSSRIISVVSSRDIRMSTFALTERQLGTLRTTAHRIIPPDETLGEAGSRRGSSFFGC